MVKVAGDRVRYESPSVFVKSPLTAKQESFCLHYFVSHNATQSAIKAGYASGCAQPTSARMLSKAKIKFRLAELRQAAVPHEAVADAAIAAVRERMSLLSDIARHPVEMPVSAGHKTQAIAELNKMEGSYAPVKGELPQGLQVINVIVAGVEAAGLVQRLQAGERTVVEGGVKASGNNT